MQREKDRETDEQTFRWMDGQTDEQTYRWMDGQTKRPTDRYAYIHIGRGMKRSADGRMDRETDRQQKN